MPILHSFEENKLEYEDENEVEIKMMETKMDKESLEHNLYANDITPIICHIFSPTSNLPIKPKDSGSFRMKVVEPLTNHTPPSPHVAYLHQNALGWLFEEIHVTWAHLEKKQTRLRLYTKSLEKLCIQSVETASRVSNDDVRTSEVTALEICPRECSEKIYNCAKNDAATTSWFLATASGLPT
uniref:Uncharacterized protein n=1 Tax=Tanacetum cinerariifolium TaxID=118510 RepID=A0A6L2KDR5_TANCI|nr:hypothetical protein [Tanacetum cinerariifolium]